MQADRSLRAALPRSVRPVKVAFVDPVELPGLQCGQPWLETTLEACALYNI